MRRRLTARHTAVKGSTCAMMHAHCCALRCRHQSGRAARAVSIRMLQRLQERGGTVNTPFRKSSGGSCCRSAGAQGGELRERGVRVDARHRARWMARHSAATGALCFAYSNGHFGVGGPALIPSEHRSMRGSPDRWCGCGQTQAGPTPERTRNQPDPTRHAPTRKLDPYASLPASLVV